jgi:superfamily II DNA or RNA helicase
MASTAADPRPATKLTRSGYLVRKDSCPPADIRAMKKELTAESTVPDFFTGRKGACVVAWQESEQHLCVPKFYGLKKLGLPVADALECGQPMNDAVVFEGKLRAEQEEPVARFLEAARDPLRLGGILSLPTGGGKTCAAINIMCKLRVRTLVVVHKAFLMDQWRERIRQFAPQARIGRIQGSTMDVEGCDVVLAMLQSLCRKVYPPSVTAGFGLMVVDECHHMGAEVFSRALQRVVCRVSLGLSATVERRDGLTKVFLWHLGDVVYHMAGRSDDGSVMVQVRKYVHPRAACISCPQLHNGKPDLPKMVGAIVDDGDRNDFVCSILAELGAAGRKTLVLSERRAHLHTLRDRLKASGASSVGLYYGGLTPAVLKESEACRVVLGTYSMAQEGLDIPGLDSLILATPKGEVTQAVGRILRDRPETRRHSPLVLDVVDSIIFDAFFERQARKRKALYTRRGFSVHVHREHPTMDP